MGKSDPSDGQRPRDRGRGFGVAGKKEWNTTGRVQRERIQSRERADERKTEVKLTREEEQQIRDQNYRVLIQLTGNKADRGRDENRH